MCGNIREIRDYTPYTDIYRNLNDIRNIRFEKVKEYERTEYLNSTEIDNTCRRDGEG